MDPMQEEQAQQKLIDYDVIRGEVFQIIVKQHSIASFHEYWNDFGSFTLGRLSKREFDATVLKMLTAEHVHLHNNLVAAVLNNIQISQQLRFQKVKSSLARKVIREVSGQDFCGSNADEEQKAEKALQADYKAFALEEIKKQNGGSAAGISQTDIIQYARAIQKNVRTTLGMEVIPVMSDSAAATPTSSSGSAAGSTKGQGPAMSTLSTLLSPIPRQGPLPPTGPPSILHVPPNNPIPTTTNTTTPTTTTNNNSAIHVPNRPGVDSTSTVVQSAASGPIPNPPSTVTTAVTVPVAVAAGSGPTTGIPFNALNHVGVPGGIPGGGLPPSGPSSEHLSNGNNGTGLGGFPPPHAMNLPPFPLANRANKRPRLNVNVPTPLLSNSAIMSSGDHGGAMQQSHAMGGSGSLNYMGGQGPPRPMNPHGHSQQGSSSNTGGSGIGPGSHLMTHTTDGSHQSHHMNGQNGGAGGRGGVMPMTAGLMPWPATSYHGTSGGGGLPGTMGGPGMGGGRGGGRMEGRSGGRMERGVTSDALQHLHNRPPLPSVPPPIPPSGVKTTTTSGGGSTTNPG